jgi:hypothetical protein
MCAGVIMNLGVEQGADLQATFFCGSDLAQEIINEYELNLRGMADRALTLVKYVSLFIL